MYGKMTSVFAAVTVCASTVVAADPVVRKTGAGEKTVDMSAFRDPGAYVIVVEEGRLRLEGKAAAPSVLPAAVMLTMKDKSKVAVRHPRGTGLVRTEAGAETVVSVDADSESPPFAFSGPGKTVKEGAGTLVIGPGDGRSSACALDLRDGSVIARGGALPVIDVGGEGAGLWVSSVYPPVIARTPEEMTLSGVMISKKPAAGSTFAKTGPFELAVSRISGVRRVTVMSGALRIARPVGCSGETVGGNLVANPGFEKHGAMWRKYVHPGKVTYSTQYSTPAFTYATDSWAFGYAMLDGEYCGRLHNNGGVSTRLNFPEAGTYRLVFHMRPRADSSANPMLAFLDLQGGGRVEILKTTPPRTYNFLEYSCEFTVPAAGTHTLVFTGTGVPTGKTDARKRDDGNRSTMIDGVSVTQVKAVAEKPSSEVQQALPKDAYVTVADGATLVLDEPVTNVVKALRLGSRRVSGVVNASTHPKYVSGLGSLLIAE